MTFQPPDGENEIFTYRTSRPFQPPFTFSINFETVMAKVVVVRLSIQSLFPAETVLGPISFQSQIDNFLASGLSVKNFMASTQGSARPPNKWSRLITDTSCYTANLI